MKSELIAQCEKTIDTDRHSDFVSIYNSASFEKQLSLRVKDFL